MTSCGFKCHRHVANTHTNKHPVRLCVVARILMLQHDQQNATLFYAQRSNNHSFIEKISLKTLIKRSNGYYLCMRVIKIYNTYDQRMNRKSRMTQFTPRTRS